MEKYNLYMIARKVVGKNKGILASDERSSSVDKKFSELGIEPNEENRRKYRELIICTPGIEDYLNGIILFDETIRQKDSTGTPFTNTLKEKDILIGIKVDEGTEPLRDDSDEELTRGLAGLDERLTEYYNMGALFTKWRAVYKISENKPTEECLHKNSMAMADYALKVQKHGMVPIVEPEVLMEGTHTIEQCEEITKKSLQTFFEISSNAGVDFKSLILKTSMVIPGSLSEQNIDSNEIAERTIKVLTETVPHDLPGVVFLSGGQLPVEATRNLDAIAKKEPLPWEIAFSFLRAIEQPALEIWQGKDENIIPARKALIERLKLNVLADKGIYSN